MWPALCQTSASRQSGSSGVLEADSAERLAEQEQRLVAEGAAAVEPADVALARRRAAAAPPARGAGRAAASAAPPPPASATASRAASSSVRTGWTFGRRTRAGVGAEEIDHDRLAGRARPRPAPARRPRGRAAWRSGRSTLVAGSAASASRPCSMVMPPTSALQVVAAGADRLRDALAPAIDQAGHLLQPGAGRRDGADLAAAHHVGEAERDAADDRRAAVRPHHQQVVLAGRSA